MKPVVEVKGYIMTSQARRIRQFLGLSIIIGAAY
jgi:hypothetical protein